MTREELTKQFSSPLYDADRPYIQKIMEAFTDITDEKVILGAAGWMMDAQEEGVDLDPRDAVRLTKAYKPTPIPELVSMLKSAGISTLEDLDKIFQRADKEESQPGGDKADLLASVKAEQLEMYAARLTQNPDIILLGRPILWDMDTAWVKLAFLCDELTKEEQDILAAMKDIADRPSLRADGGIPTAIFRIDNIHAK